jgi:hypothetical protein
MKVMQKEQMQNAPMRVVIAYGSKAAATYSRAAGVNPDALAPGFKSSPANDLIFHGGKTLQDLKFANFYVAGETAWSAGDIRNIDQALDAALSDRNLNNVMVQYFNNQPITSTFLGSQKLSGDAPAVVSQGDVELLVGTLQKQGALAGMDLSSTLVNILLPRGTVLTTDELPTSAALPAGLVANAQAAADVNPAIPIDDQASSLNGLGGYHGSVHQTMSGVGVTLYYAIGAYSETRPDGSSNGIPAFAEPWKSVVATFYHELNEARTDADVEDAIRTGQIGFTGWTSNAGEEIGDGPIRLASDIQLVFQEVPLANGAGTVPVQFMYSNAVHGPEGPIPKPH